MPRVGLSATGDELIYSEYDEEHDGLGFYWQDFDNRVSQSFATREEAVAAYRDGEIVWED